MMKRYPGWNWSSIFTGAKATGGAITLMGCFAIAFSESRALAEVTSDNTLNTQVTPNGNIYEIRNGTPVNRPDGTVNLFHSFGSFSVPAGWTAEFLNGANVANIFGRVTGGTKSDIQGIIKAQGQANLFLMNPSGIIFGQNAQLNIGGSFVGTTANAIRFPGDGEFPSNRSPVDLNNPVLAVNPNALFFNKTPAGISVSQSTLQVQPGRNLFLVGGEVRLENGGTVRAPGGRIVLGGLAESGKVEIVEAFDRNNPDLKNNPNLDFPDVTLEFPEDVERSDVSLINGAVVDVVANNGGDIFINARNINISGGTNVCAGIGANGSSCGTPGSGTGSLGSTAGNIAFDATGQVSISQSRIENNINPGASGNSANIFEAIANDTLFGSIIILTGSLSMTDGAQISTSTYGTGSAGLVFVQARDAVSLGKDTSMYSRVESGAKGDAGGILIETGSLSLTDGANIDSSTYGRGTAGTVAVDARGAVSLANGSYIFSNVESGGIGNAGSINITAESLSLLSGSQVQTIVRGNEFGQQPGQGNAGQMEINVGDTITIDGVGPDGFYSAIFSSVGRGASGSAGNIQISTRSLSLSNNGLIDTSLGTEAGGDGTIGTAGSIFIEATDSVSLKSGATIRTVIQDNASESGGATSPFAGNIFGALSGRGGDVTGTILISTGKLSLEGGAVLNTSTYGNGNAGAVVVVADDEVSLKGGAIGSIVGEQATGDAGAILMSAGSLSIASTSDNVAGLTTTSLGQGDAGLIYVVADGEVSLKGGGISSIVGEKATGDAGAILMKVGSLSIASTSDYDAGLTTETKGQGNAGLVYVEADKDISIRGNESGTESGIASRVSEGSTYNSGGIILNARSLFLRDEEAKVTVNNQGSGFAGGIYINMREDIILRDQGEISATASSGSGAEIYLTSGDFLVLVSGSKVTTEAGQNTNFGNGGNVFIDTRYLIAAPFKDNNIDANAFLGSGGNIRVDASRLYDIKGREGASPQSNDITASSDYGPPGQVGTSPLNPDPTQGLANLPANPVDPTTLIAETCAPRGGIAQRRQNRFIVTGRGGLPPDPNAAFPGEAGVNDLGTPEGPETNTTDAPNSVNPASPTPAVTPPSEKPEVDKSNSANPASSDPAATATPQKPEPVEAQGWVYGKNGDIIFTAQAPTITPNHPVLTPSSTCNAVSKSPQ